MRRFCLLLLLLLPSTYCAECNPFYVRWPRVKLNFKAVTNARQNLQACESACSLNEDPSLPGRKLECAALNHHKSPDNYSHECDVFQPHQLQNVDGYVEADDRYSFFWKYCLNSTRKCAGEYAFTYLSDRYMDSREVIRVSKKNSLEECLAECLEETKFPCRSISFNRTDGGCHFSSDSQLTKPGSVRLNNNPNFRIDYYESNCYNLSDTFHFEHECLADGIQVRVKSKFPYTGALYGLYDFFTCRVEPKEATDMELFFPANTISKNCSDSIRYKGNEMILDVVLSTDGVEPLYFITPDDMTYQAKCPIVHSNNKDDVLVTKTNIQRAETTKEIDASTHALFTMLSEEANTPEKTTVPLTTPTTTSTTSTTTTSPSTTTTTTAPTTTSTTPTPPPSTSTSTTTTTTTSKPSTSKSTTTTVRPTTSTTRAPSTTTRTTRPSTTTTTTTTTTKSPLPPSFNHKQQAGPPAPSVGGKIRQPVSFDIYKDGRAVDAVVVGSKITLSFTPHYPIPPEYMSIRGCQVEPIDPKYEWEKEPLPIIKDACPADLVGLVCPPKHSEFGIKVTVESFRYQTTPQVQYSCLVRICPFAPCPTSSCHSVDGCPSDDRSKRALSLEEIRRALQQDPAMAREFGISPSILQTPPAQTVEQQLIALGGDHMVKRRLVVVNSEDQLRYYVNTGNLS